MVSDREDMDNTTKSYYNSPIVYYSNTSQYKRVEQLLDDGADINSTDECNRTPLHCALSNNSVELVKLLVSRGANLSLPDWNKLEPIHRASMHSSPVCVKILLDNGSGTGEYRSIDKGNFYINQKLPEDYISDKTPLHWSCIRRDCGEITKLLLEYGAYTESVDKIGRTPLHYACIHNNLEAVNILISYGADINSLDVYLKTPLSILNIYNKSIKPLIVGGADLKGVNYHIPNDVILERERTMICTRTKRVFS